MELNDNLKIRSQSLPRSKMNLWSPGLPLSLTVNIQSEPEHEIPSSKPKNTGSLTLFQPTSSFRVRVRANESILKLQLPTKNGLLNGWSRGTHLLHLNPTGFSSGFLTDLLKNPFSSWEGSKVYQTKKRWKRVIKTKTMKHKATLLSNMTLQAKSGIFFLGKCWNDGRKIKDFYQKRKKNKYTKSFTYFSSGIR